MAQRLGRQIHVEIACDGVSDNQRWTGQVRCLDLAVNATFEVPIAGENRADDETCFVDGGFDRCVKRTRVPDAGRAAVTNRVEAHGVQVFLQTRGFVVFRHDTATGSEGGAHPGFDLETSLTSLSSQQTCGEHHTGVGGVGARGDGSDDDIAVIEVEHLPVHFNDGAVREVFLRQSVSVVAEFVREAFNEVGFHVVKVDAVLRSLRTCKGGNDLVEIQPQHSGVGLFFSTLTVPEALGFGVGFDPCNGLVVATGEPEIFNGPLIDREKAARGAVFGRHVGDGGTVGEGKRLHSGAEEFHKLSNHAVFPQHLHNAQGHVGGRDAGVQVPG